MVKTKSIILKYLLTLASSKTHSGVNFYGKSRFQ